ncbi:MFS transporter [Streptomyces sp. FL07-04A]|uniref:MFS transporter n=1 Tax=Streptomyces sp. FL07-04A TaxID=3028658 RepID=UPI0029A16610|nr:MFS transporter [Streptomyces sp. FL07-04A]MDX3575402.1 MFS transporter [Streptomyces sp. FL07-04A]
MTALEATSSGEQEGELNPKRWIALTVILVAAFMDMLDSTILNVAIPSIRTDLDAGYADIQWVTAGYQLAFALLLILGGRLGDIYGRKRIFQIGVAGFTLASLAAAVSVDPGMLIVSRLAQGGFASIMVPQVLAIIHVSFPPQERAKAFGMFGTVAGLAALTGLSLGGLLVEWDLFGLEWRLVFLINIPVGLFGLIVGQKSIVESKAPVALRLDIVGAVLAAVTLFLLVFPLIQGRELGWPAWGFVLLALTPVALFVFIRQQQARTRKDGSPLVALNLFRLRSFSSALSVQLAFNIGVGVFFLSWSLYMQVGLGWSPIRAGLTSLPFCIATFITSALSYAFLAAKMGRKLLQLGAVLVLLGLGSYIWVVEHYGSGATSWKMALPLALFGLGFGMVMSPIPDMATSEAPRQDAGSASGLVNTNQQLGFAVGTALVSVIFFGALGGNAADNSREAAPQLRKDLAAVSVTGQGADRVVDYFVQCTSDQAKEKDWTVQAPSCAKAPSELTGNPKVAAVFADTGKHTNALTFADTFAHALRWFIGGMVLTLLLTFLLPRKNAAHGEQAGAGTEPKAVAENA